MSSHLSTNPRVQMFSKERLLELVSSLASSAAQIARKSFSQGEAFWFHNDLSGQGRLHLKRVIERCLCLPEIGTSSVTAAPIQEPAAGCERKDVLLNCAERCRSWLRRKYISRKAKGKGSFSTFDQVINNMKLSTLPAYASSLRQSRAGAGLGPTSGFKCALRTSPKFGSYHLAFPVVFKDGAKWLFKIPAAGYVGRWDSSAARALRSEALTMRMLRQQTSIPIPEVYSFDASLDNDFRCPFILMEYMDGEPLYESKHHVAFLSVPLHTQISAINRRNRMVQWFCLDRGAGEIPRTGSSKPCYCNSPALRFQVFPGRITFLR